MKKIYDYRINTQAIIQAQEHLDGITNRQLIKLSEYLHTLEKEDEIMKMDYVQNILLPVLQQFTKREEGTLQIIDNNLDDVISVIVTIPNSCALDESCTDVRAAIMMASYISFKSINDQLEIELSYD